MALFRPFIPRTRTTQPRPPIGGTGINYLGQQFRRFPPQPPTSPILPFEEDAEITGGAITGAGTPTLRPPVYIPSPFGRPQGGREPGQGLLAPFERKEFQAPQLPLPPEFEPLEDVGEFGIGGEKVQELLDSVSQEEIDAIQDKLKTFDIKTPLALLRVGEAVAHLAFGDTFDSLEPWQQQVAILVGELPIWAAIPAASPLRAALATKIALETSRIARTGLQVGRGALLPVELLEKAASQVIKQPFKLSAKGVRNLKNLSLERIGTDFEKGAAKIPGKEPTPKGIKVKETGTGNVFRFEGSHSDVPNNIGKVVLSSEPNYSVIVGLNVNEAIQRKGVGTRLILDVLEKAGQIGKPVIIEKVTPAGDALLKSMESKGFIKLKPISSKVDVKASIGEMVDVGGGKSISASYNIKLLTPTPKGVVPPPPIALPPASEEYLFDDALRIIREKVIPAQKVARGKTAKIFTEERGKAFGEVEKVFKTPAGEATVGEAAKKLGIGEMERAAFEPVEGILSQAHKDAVINELATNINLKAAEKFNAMLSLKRLFSPLKYVVEHPKTASTVPPNTPLRDFELKILEKAWGKSTADDLAKAIEMLAADPIPVDIAMKNYLLGLKNIPFGKPKIGETFIPTQPIKVPVEAYRGQRLQELMIDLADSPTPINPTIQEAVKRTEQFFLMPPTKREKFLKILGRVGYNAIDALGIPKTVKFSFDLSYPLRQGLLLGLKSPKKWVTQWKPMIKALRSDEVASKFHRELLSDTETATAINRMGVDLYGVERGMKWTERPEELASTIAEHIPGIRASARAAATFMNGLMAESTVKQYRVLTALGESEGSFRAMGALINQLAGRGTLPKWLRGTAGDVTNKILTSPRFAVSRFQWPTKIFSESPTVRKEAAKSLIAYISWGTSLIGLAVLGGARIEGDPRSSQALKIRIGNTRIDIWAGGVQIIRMLAQLAPYVDPKTGEIDWTQGSRKTAAGEVIPMSRWDVMARFGESKVQPGIGALKILLTGKTYIGEEVDLATPEGWVILVKEGLAPLALEELVVAYMEEGIGGAALALGEFAGLGVQTYRDKPPVPSGRTPTQKDASQKARDRMNRLQKVPAAGGDAARKRAKALGLR